MLVQRAVALAAPAAEVHAVRGRQAPTDVERVEAHLDAGERARGARFVRLAAAAALGLNVVLPLIELGRMAMSPELYGFPTNPLAALVATALSAPLQLRHVAYALRGERAPAGAWSLAALAGVNVAALLVVGPGWLMNVALLAVSVLVVVPAPWSLPLYAAIVLAVGPIAATTPARADGSLGWTGAYLVFSVAWRSATLFVLLWLVAAFRRLDEARQELRDRAVVRERLRIEAELRRELGGALETIVSRAATAAREPTSAPAELRALVGESRQALAEARRLIAGYREVSVRSELDAAMTLLGAAGIETRVVVADDRALDAFDEPSRAAVRAAGVQALRDDALARCLIQVARDGGTLWVSASADDADRARAYAPCRGPSAPYRSSRRAGAGDRTGGSWSRCTDRTSPSSPPCPPPAWGSTARRETARSPSRWRSRWPRSSCGTAWPRAGGSVRGTGGGASCCCSSWCTRPSPCSGTDGERRSGSRSPRPRCSCRRDRPPGPSPRLGGGAVVGRVLG